MTLTSWDLQLRSDPQSYSARSDYYTNLLTSAAILWYYPAVDQKGRPLSVPAVCALARLAHTRFAHRRMIDTPRAHRGRRAASLSGYGLSLRAFRTRPSPRLAADVSVSGLRLVSNLWVANCSVCNQNFEKFPEISKMCAHFGSEFFRYLKVRSEIAHKLSACSLYPSVPCLAFSLSVFRP